MHHYSFLILVFLSSIIVSKAQVSTVQDDFEGNGTISFWYGDNCGINTSLENPFQQGINTSNTVLEYHDTGGQYANVRFDVVTNFDLSTHHTFSLKIYVPSNGITGNQTNQLSMKLQDGTLFEPWSTQTEIIKPLVLDQWQILTFDFANDSFINLDPNSPDPVNRTDFNRVLLQFNGENNNDYVRAYVDDFLYDGTVGNDPAPSIYNQLVWSDEFDGSGAIDATRWHHQTQFPDGVSWFNGEVQHYTDRQVNSYREDGLLYIVAKKETYTDQGQTRAYTSARLNSKFAFTYGRVEVRAKLPFGLGTWPAIWMLGKNVNEPGGYWDQFFGTVGWPACGEIDIMEHWGFNQNYVQSALHTPSSSGATDNYGGLYAPNVSNLFHVYSMEWHPDEIRFSIDGNEYYTYAPTPQNSDNWPFLADQYILLNIAMIDPVDSGFSESPMVIDYVRVYQESTTSLSGVQSLQHFQLFPNPAEDILNIQVSPNLIGAKATVFTPVGQELNSFIIGDSLETFDWSEYPKGVYIVVFEFNSERTCYKVLKM